MKSEYVDLRALLDKIEKEDLSGEYIKTLVSFTDVDVLLIVHCCDCAYWMPTGYLAGATLQNMEPIGGCEYANFFRSASDFCSKGRLKTNCGAKMDGAADA